MIKKPTIVLLIILVLVVGLAFLIPVLQDKEKGNDLIATPRAKLLPPVQASGELMLLENGAIIAAIHQQNDGNWKVDFPTGASITSGEVEQIFSELTTMEVISPLLTPPPISAVGLDAPKQVLQLTTSDGKVIQIKVGDASPTGTGYYVIVDDSSPVVINKFGWDRVIEILNGLSPVVLVTESAPNQ